MPKQLRTPTPKGKRGTSNTRQPVDQSLIDQYFISPKKPLRGRSVKPSSNVNLNDAVTGDGMPTSGLGVPRNGLSVSEIIDVDLFEGSGSAASSSYSAVHLNLSGSPVPGIEVTIPGDSPSIITGQFPAPSTTKSIAFADLSIDSATYTPDSQPWPSRSAPYSFLAYALATVSATRSRTIIINVLTNTLRTLILRDPSSLLSAIYLLSNTLTPSYTQVELGLGASIISHSIQHVSGLTAPALKRLYNSTGDVGDVAFAAKTNLRTLVPHPPLLINYVYKSLLNIACCKGPGAAKDKQKIVEKLLIAATGEEVRFLARTLTQNLRVGAVRASILTALSRAMVLIPLSHFGVAVTRSAFHASTELLINVISLPAGRMQSPDKARDELGVKFMQAESLVKRVYVQHPNYEHITAALLQTGLDGLEESVALTLGVPLLPTLGSPTRSLEEIHDRLGDRPFSAEFKYDGQRAQIHGRFSEGNITVKIFSRHLEDMTSKYPDIVSMVECICNAQSEITSFIMDSEIVAIDTANGSLKSFQQLSNRARKDVQPKDIQVSVCVFAFDLMYLNGEILLERAFRDRRYLLRTYFPPFIPPCKWAARLDHVESCESEQGRDAIEDFWEKALDSRCEGLMVKLLDDEPVTHETSDKPVKPRRKPLLATYEPDKRTSAWLKLKKDYVNGLGDSLDLVPIGAWHGNGRKVQWWSPILLGVWDPDAGQFVGVCKCMSGFTDAFYKALSDRYPLADNSETCSTQPLWECHFGGLKPEVYFKPQEVWEIRGADITLSPVSVAAKGLVSGSRGLSVRFPRFLRVRHEKGVEQASTPRFLVNMWKTQQAQGEFKGGNDEVDLIDVDMNDSEALTDLSE